MVHFAVKVGHFFCVCFFVSVYAPYSDTKWTKRKGATKSGTFFIEPYF